MSDVLYQVDARQLRVKTTGCPEEKEEKEEGCQWDGKGGNRQCHNHAEASLGIQMHFIERKLHEIWMETVLNTISR